MKLMIILLCLAAERYWLSGRDLARFSWFEAYLTRMQSWFGYPVLWRGWLGIAFSLLPIVLAVFIVQCLLANSLFGILNLIFSLLVLYYCLGPDDFFKQLDDYFTLSATSGNDKAIKQLQSEFLEEDPPQAVDECNRAMTNAILVRANERLIAVIFWFIVFGPLGLLAAVVYRGVNLLQKLAAKPDSPFAALASASICLQNGFDWLPVRISTLIYTLIGHYRLGFSVWLAQMKSGFSANTTVLTECGLKALGNGAEAPSCATLEENRAALTLVNRVVFILIFIVAVFTLGAWVS